MVLAALAASVLLCVGSAQAVMYFNESFDYAANLGDSVGDISGWPSVTGFVFVGGLDTPSIGNESGFGAQTPTTTASVIWTNALAGTTRGDVTWFCFVFKDSGLNKDGFRVLYEGDGGTDGYGVHIKELAGDFVEFYPSFGDHFTGGANPVLTDDGPVFFVVGKAQKSVKTTTIWVNPPASALVSEAALLAWKPGNAKVQTATITFNDRMYLRGVAGDIGQVDEIRLADSLVEIISLGLPSNPVPNSGEPFAPTSLTSLQWDNPNNIGAGEPNFFSDPNNPVLTYNLYFGLEPNLLEIPKIITGASTTQGITETADLTGLVDLNEFETYYWAVELVGSGEGKLQGPLWSFTLLDNTIPTVSIPVKTITYKAVSGDPNSTVASVSVVATAVDPDAGQTLTYTWDCTGASNPNAESNTLTEAQVDAQLAGQNSATATLTNVTQGTYWLTCTVSDGYISQTSAVGGLYVADNTCSAGKISDNYDDTIPDLNDDCKITLGDLAVIAGRWLACYTIDCLGENAAN
jgi:hypothetical protein